MIDEENPAQLSEEAEELVTRVDAKIRHLEVLTAQAQIIAKAAMLVGVRAMLERFEGVDLDQHGLKRLKGQLTGQLNTLRRLNKQTHSNGQKGTKTRSRPTRQGQKQQDQSLKIRPHKPFQRRRPK